MALAFALITDEEGALYTGHLPSRAITAEERAEFDAHERALVAGEIKTMTQAEIEAMRSQSKDPPE